MSLAKVLLCLDPDAQPSVFDSVVAIDAGAQQLLRHGGVRAADVRNLVYGLMFTRGPQQLRSSAVFIGGSDAQQGESLLKAAVESFLGPLRVSVMLDSNGCNTTSAAAVLCARKHVPLQGAVATVLAATGPVGRRVVRLLAAEGARVRVASRRQVHAEGICDRISAATPGADLTPITVDSPAAAEAAAEGAELIVACGPPGVELLGAESLGKLPTLQALIDLNAVPPHGLGGILPHDEAEVRHGKICFGAFGVGKYKMQIHKAALARLFEQNDLVLDVEEIYQLGRELWQAN
jgi:methylenetetrahydrofolate/methylenetetrahydromethanopterin dehydrogenase (NADP+)